MYQQYLTTNTRILDGENPHIKFQKDGFTVSTPTQEESEAGSVHQFFPERDFVPMLEILATVDHHTGWMEEFQHWQQRYHQGRPEERVIYAGVIGLGCTIGIRKMARISHPLSETERENAINWYFSLDNVDAANDRVLQLMDRLEFPNILRRTQGPSAYCQRWAEIRSAGRFAQRQPLLQILRQGTGRQGLHLSRRARSVMALPIHSTDAFGYGEAIFATSNLVGVASAPRFKNLKRQRRYIFRGRQSADRSGWKIPPQGYVDEDHIIQLWDDILRFIATIKLKETTEEIQRLGRNQAPKTDRLTGGWPWKLQN